MVAGCGEERAGAPFQGVILDLRDTYVTEGGEITTSRDLSQFTSVEAQVVAADGAVQAFAGALSEDGARWEIPGVPDGEYWLVTTTPPDERAEHAPERVTMMQMTARSVDFGRTFAGRPDAGAATQAIDVALTAGGLGAWHQITRDEDGETVQWLQDSIELYSFNADALAGASPAEGDPGAPEDGDKALSGWTFDWHKVVLPSTHDDAARPLVDGSQGDVLHVTQLVQHQVEPASGEADPHDPWSSFTYNAAEASFSTAEVNMQDGKPVALGGAFAPLDPSSLAVDLKISRFVAQVTAHGPAALADTFTSFFLVQEPGTGVPVNGWTPTLLSAAVFSNQEPVDETCFPYDGSCDTQLCPDGCNDALNTFHPGDHARTYEYGNPYRARGMEMLDVIVTFRTRVTHPVEMTTETLRGHVEVILKAEDANGAAVEPLLGLPRSLKLDGKSLPADEVTEQVGTTPVIHFEPPDLGTPDGYFVGIVLYDDLKDAGDEVVSARTSVLSVDTTETSIQVPEGVLESGRYYSVQVTAYKGLKTQEAPFKYDGTTQARAQSYTGLFTP
ncbi:hypothetical protein [Sorangium sp. So ce131]|uniref:hypothetical protein n=1 Tax=Sorangium sp. So ce131 TaxID=3133282 RepID=UPI003F63E49D